MTREEVSVIIGNIPIEGDDCYTIAEYQEAKAMAIQALEQEPRVGHWIFCEGIKGKDNVEKCSCCQSHWKEAVIYRSDTQEYLRIRLLYCPNCGAKMEEKENDK